MTVSRSIHISTNDPVLLLFMVEQYSITHTHTHIYIYIKQSECPLIDRWIDRWIEVRS